MKNLAKIRSGLARLYRDWQPKGLVSLYIWGSAVTVDYDPAISDMDVMGIIDSDANEKDFEILDRTVSDYLPGVNDPGLRVLYFSELQTGHPRSWMGGIIHPRLLLLDIPTWIHVAGKKFNRTDFPINDLTPTEALCYKLEEVYDRHYREINQQQESAHYYFCKSLYRVCYYFDQITTDHYPFSYSALHRTTNPEIKPIIAELEKLKRSHWDKQLFEAAHPRFREYVSSLKHRYAATS